MRRSPLFLSLTFCFILLGSAHASSDIQKNREGYYGAGVFVGTPGQAAEEGILFKTLEVSIARGAFANDARFPGDERKYSMANKDVYNQFEKLDPKKTYAFSFVRRHPMNIFHIENSGTLIQKIEEINPERTAELAGGMKTDLGRTGGYGKGTISGRLVRLERWGLLGHWMCTINIAPGGLEKITKEIEKPVTTYDKKGRPSTGVTTDTVTVTQMKLRALNIYDEKMCQFAEKVLSSGTEVQLSYSEDYFEWWDKNRKIVHEILLTSEAKSADIAQANGEVCMDKIDGMDEKP